MQTEGAECRMNVCLPEIENFYSAEIRFVYLMRCDDEQFVNDCVYIFSAKNSDAAYERAVAIGRERENVVGFVNMNGDHVVIKFVEIITLNKVKDCGGGFGVHSDFSVVNEDSMYEINHKFIYRRGSPNQTI